MMLTTSDDGRGKSGTAGTGGRPAPDRFLTLWNFLVIVLAVGFDYSAPSAKGLIMRFRVGTASWIRRCRAGSWAFCAISTMGERS